MTRPKTALVTGAASGIGLAVARRLADSGARVALLDVVDASEWAAEMSGTSYEVDLADRELTARTVGQAGADLGGLDMVVNCAGWDRAMLFVDTNPEFWVRVIDVNLLGPIAVTHAALAHLRDGGAIVNVASDAGRVGSSGEVVYSGAKGGVIAFTKALAREVARRGIRVNAVAPGPTDTPFLASFDESGKLAEAMTRQTPLGKLATPEDVAAAVCFLASEDAGHITGQVLSVSGGLTMV